MLSAISTALAALAKGDAASTRADALATIADAFRALNLWAHGAHLVAKGTGFAGDHAELLGPLYQKAGEAYDSVVERAIGLGAADDVADPVSRTAGALRVVRGWPSVLESEGGLMQAALTAIEAVSATLTDRTEAIADAGVMTRGLDNLLAQLSDDLEGFAYQFGRRVAE